MPVVHEEIPEAPGPNATMQFGDATRTQSLLKEAQTAGGPGPAPGPQGQPAFPPVPQHLLGGPPSAVQPAPPGLGAPQQGQIGREDVRPGGTSFDQDEMPPMVMEPERSSLEWLREVADHPRAGPALRRLRDVADGLERPQR